MTSKTLVASLFAVVAAAAATAQSDRIHLVNGEVVKDVKVTDFDVRSIRYKKSGSDQSKPSDQVARVVLGDFKTVYARGLNDADLMLTLAKEQIEAKNSVMAQLGLTGASARYFDTGRPAEAVDALNLLEKTYPEGGLLPEVYRQKFEYYMGAGSSGVASALTVAKKYETAAIGGAWPPGFAIEAKFFQVLSEKSSPNEYQQALRGVISRAGGSNRTVANRASIELAHSLRESGKGEEAKRLYDDMVAKDGADDSSRAGAYLGLGKILFEEASNNDKDKYKEALLMFLRVRLETRDAWPSLQAEALYQASQAAIKWRGPEYRLIVARCRGVLLNDFKNSEWAEAVRQSR